MKNSSQIESLVFLVELSVVAICVILFIYFARLHIIEDEARAWARGVDSACEEQPE